MTRLEIINKAVKEGKMTEQQKGELMFAIMLYGNKGIEEAHKRGIIGEETKMELLK